MQKSATHTDCETCAARFHSVFHGLEGDNLQEVNYGKACSVFKKSSYIFNEGQYPQGVYCVNKGKVKVMQTGDEGKEQIVRLAKEGDILGYRALLSGEKYSSSAVAIDDSSVCFIPKAIFFKILEKDAPLSMEIMKLLSSDLKKAENKITDLAQKPVRERMAEALLFLKETYGYEPGTTIINVVLSREDIANIVGTATETAIRLISEFKQSKIIESIGKKIQIIDLPKLIKTANVSD
jgi:CRP/FNR family transcriptional regulator, polysaccharide utilization system transcription regulator